MVWALTFDCQVERRASRRSLVTTLGWALYGMPNGRSRRSCVGYLESGRMGVPRILGYPPKVRIQTPLDSQRKLFSVTEGSLSCHSCLYFLTVN